LIVPVLVRSKRAALTTTDISNLHQIGLAASIYASDYDGAWPMTVFPLWDAGLIRDKRILHSPLDKTSEGFAYHLAKELKIPVFERTDVSLSYPGVAHYAYTRRFFESDIVPAHNPGWLISSNSGERIDGYYSVVFGTYNRLLLDGSVQTRHMNWVTGSTPFDKGKERFFMAALYFVDEDASWASARL
ncbi:MAG TPA: hypothetical protein VNI20_06750, partial [Fimbriimonadaceae bacterium]|nr:hypothetical protein [Fimbriimonadaceae bacterium]